MAVTLDKSTLSSTTTFALGLLTVIWTFSSLSPSSAAITLSFAETTTSLSVSMIIGLVNVGTAAISKLGIFPLVSITTLPCLIMAFEKYHFRDRSFGLQQ